MPEFIGALAQAWRLAWLWTVIDVLCNFLTDEGASQPSLLSLRTTSSSVFVEFVFCHQLQHRYCFFVVTEICQCGPLGLTVLFLRKEKYVKGTKHSVQDLIPPPSIYIRMRTLYTNTNTYFMIFSPSGFFRLFQCLVLTPGLTSEYPTCSVCEYLRIHIHALSYIWYSTTTAKWLNASDLAGFSCLTPVRFPLSVLKERESEREKERKRGKRMKRKRGEERGGEKRRIRKTICVEFACNLPSR